MSVNKKQFTLFTFIQCLFAVIFTVCITVWLFSGGLNKALISLESYLQGVGR